MTSAENKTQNVFDGFIEDYTSTSLIAGLNKYRSKEELQALEMSCAGTSSDRSLPHPISNYICRSGEFDASLSTGLEMLLSNNLDLNPYEKFRIVFITI